MFMKKSFLIIILATLALMPMHVSAQGLKDSGKSAADVVPNGWESIFKTGDLNNDGIADLVVVATPCDKDKMQTRDDGYVYNFNQPVLAIYWGEKNGGYMLFKQYDKVIPARESEFISLTPSLSITSKGVLRIDMEVFASAGGWDATTTTYSFRYQNGDFFLIGKDESTVTRNTGVTTVTSDNYLTGRRCVSTGKISSKKTKEKWSRLPKQPLRPMGEPLE